MRNLILTILFAVLCSAGFATSAQDAATDQAQAAAVAHEGVEVAAWISNVIYIVHRQS